VQLRYALLVAGSLSVLLLFTGFHALFAIKQVLPPDMATQIAPALAASSFRVFVVGVLYIGVVTLAAVFLSHRAVGPLGRLEDEIRRMRESPEVQLPLKTRSGDDLEPLINELNGLIEKIRGQR